MTRKARLVPATALSIVLVGAVLGFLVLTLLPILPLTTDAVRYDQTGLHLAETGEMAMIEGKVLPPGYPAFLAAIYLVAGHSQTAVYFVQFVLIGLCGALTFFIAYRHFSLPYWLSLVFGLAVTFWPYMVLHAMLVLSEILAITIMLVALISLLCFVRDRKLSYMLSGGLLLGLATLVRPVMLLLPFWIVTLLFIYFRVSKKRLLSWRAATIFFFAFLFPLVWWQTYFYASQRIVSGSFSYIPAVIAKSLNLTYEQAPPERISDLIASQDTAQATPAMESLPSIAEVAMSKVKNVFLFWNPGAGGYQAQAYIDRYPMVNMLIWCYRIGFLILLALAFSTLRWWREPPIALAWIVILYFWGVHTILFPYPRYMLPLIPLVLALAATALYRYWPLVQPRCAPILTAVQQRLRIKEIR